MPTTALAPMPRERGRTGVPASSGYRPMNQPPRPTSFAPAFAAGLATILIAGSACAAAIGLSPAQEQALGVRTAAVVPARAQPLASVPATFTPPPSGRAAVSAPFAGVITQVLVVEGQAVRSGQVLASVFSRDALNASAELGQSRAEADLAQAAAARTNRLVEEGIIAGARASEATARARAAQAMLSAKSISVRAAGAGSSGRYALRAPFAGKVVDVQVTVGQGLEAMATAFIVDRQDRIQVEGVLPAALAGKVRAGARAVVEGVEGRVVAVGAEIDPKTRSLLVRAELPPRPDFIPGRSTRVDIFDQAAGGAVEVPRNAVTSIGGRDVVFVRGASGFSATPVTVKGWNGDRAILAGAPPAGAQVAVAGVSELKARSGN